MSDEPPAGRYSIGRLADLVGLPVKTIRFYSDVGLLPPAGRTEAGHCRYGEADLARLQLIRSLRELEVDLPSIRRVLDGHDEIGDVLEAHIATLERRIGGLKRCLLVLRAAAASPADVTVRRLGALIRLDGVDRRQLLEHFWERVGEGLPEGPGLDWLRPAGTPELPDEPTDEQLDAWLDLAELAAGEDFTRTTHDDAGWLSARSGPPVSASRSWRAQGRSARAARSPGTGSRQGR